MAQIRTEIANIQKEKERIATTTIDEELAADPKLAEVGGSAGGRGTAGAWEAGAGAGSHHRGRPCRRR